jgi:hypothetical protein
VIHEVLSAVATLTHSHTHAVTSEMWVTVSSSEYGTNGVIHEVLSAVATLTHSHSDFGDVGHCQLFRI